MITVGVVRELAYMSGYVGVEVCTSIDVSGKIIGLRVSENYVKISSPIIIHRHLQLYLDH